MWPFLKLGGKLAWGWFTGGGAQALTDIYDKFKDSSIAHEQIQAAWAKNQLDAMVSVRLATINFPEARIATAIIGSVFVTHLVLVGIVTMTGWSWDGKPVKAFPSPFDEWEGAILLSFFGLTAGAKVASGVLDTVKSWFNRKT